MKKRSLSIAFLMAAGLAGNSGRAQEGPVLDLGNKRELFVDRYLVAQTKEVTFKLHHPHNEGPVLYFNQPWEGNFSGYGTVIKDAGLYRLYYRGIRQSGKDGAEAEVTCYAESIDGQHWKKPDLGIYEIGNSRANNVILAHVAPVTHNFSPFLDTNPETKLAYRYKALGGIKKSGLIPYVSADGIHWKPLREQPVITQGDFDSQNVAFWSAAEKQYVCYLRTSAKSGNKSFRSVSRTTSADFINWTTPEPMQFGDVPLDHLYTQQTGAYYRAPHIYVAIGARFMPGRQVVSDEQAAALKVNPAYYKDCSDAVLMTTRGGNEYHREFLESFIRPDIGLENWVSRTNYPVLNVVPTSETEMSVFMNESYAQEGAHIKRYSMRIDGFASLNAGMKEGTVLTRPFVFSGKELELNYSTSAAGALKIEVQDIKGNPIPGYTMSDAQEIIGNEIKRIASWKGNTDLSALAGTPVKLRIYLKDADLFSLKFN
ncbi:glycoside hydrolase family protein [Niabella drilacis]|uniref:Glycosyl hydrolases family 32 N-terminal domain-containing protein n=1 Tax=Niabella drilacis (strain DSM 25811 / CCM 8410 / CCUG 62505 / LMG 26954 / E90) TaxID=1285928 RepID=A0A1G6LXD5_NIADE|nr:hypothetical protein [Niabella drilacis]SDC47405.1 hypothetical protein SAMN04487894_102477 [Niabella drilacis]